tara:strand:+ start:4573 stop:10167 length:5595 start_codon:yes stop_codon:yes gene_type:complete
MAEIKRSFAKAKMNKDVDERLLPSGEYVDALNVQAQGSGGGDAGALQNIKGNLKLTSMSDDGGVYNMPVGAKCVGAISDPEKDVIYYLVRASNTLSIQSYNQWNTSKDYIIEVGSLGTAYVFVDLYEVSFTIPAISGANTFSTADFTGLNNALRVGMTFGLHNDDGEKVTITSVVGTTVTLSDTVTVTSEERKFKARRVLELPDGKLITGLNVLGRSLYWTDNEHEPKRINIDRCKKGTGFHARDSVSPGAGGHDKFHTRLLVESPDYENQDTPIFNAAEEEPVWVGWSDVSVLKKSPKTALKINMASTPAARMDGVGNELNTLGHISNKKIHGSLFSVGDFIEDIVFDSPVTFYTNDLVEFNIIDDGSIGEAAVTAKVSYSPCNASNTLSVTTGIKFEILTMSSSLIDIFYNWSVEIRSAKPLFDTELARFSYRWRYQDGEYSTFAPWTQPAFLPSEYGYYAQNGFNTGMESRLRSLVLENYISKNIPSDVVDIDLLYKQTNNPTVYTVETVSRSKKAEGWTDTHPEGSYRVKTDMVHAIVASNQLLRPWDNVPRKALAQEVSANRLIYGNYLQNFDVFSEPDVNSSVKSKIVMGVGEASIKSMRDYQIGLVWHGELGRETPVLPVGRHRVDQFQSASSNSFELGIASGSTIPSWATHYSCYVKEPTVEYYNLSMDRWYNAADGNIWVSFPSSERNKITDETFLRLKKAHGNDVAVSSSPEYKVLAIENEAPDHIKKLYKKVSTVNNTSELALIGNSSGGYPLVGMKVITIAESAITGLVGVTSKSWRLRFSDDDEELKSRHYDVDKVTFSDDSYNFHLRLPIGNDCSFATTDGEDNTFPNRIDELTCRLFEGEINNRPEFDGRFFVKIKRDATIESNVIAQGNFGDWIVSETIPISLLNNKFIDSDTDADFPYKSIKSEVGLSLDNLHPTEELMTISGTAETAYAWGSSDQFIDETFGDFDITNTPISTISGEHASQFWYWMMNKRTFFIDSCSAYSWNGRNLPGSQWDDALNFDGTDELWKNGSTTTLGDWARASDHVAFNTAGAGSMSGFDNIMSNGGPAFHNGSIISDYSGGGGWPSGSVPIASNGSRGMWNDVAHGYMDISWTGFSNYPASVSSLTELSTEHRPTLLRQTHGQVDAPEHLIDARAVIEKLIQNNTKFRFRRDPDKTEYNVKVYMPRYRGSSALYQTDLINSNGNYAKSESDFFDTTAENVNTLMLSDEGYMAGIFGIRNYASKDWIGGILNHQFDGHNLRQKWTVKVSPKFGSGFHGYMPTTGTDVNPNEYPGAARVRALHHDSTDLDYIELLVPASVDDDGNDMSSGFVSNPAVFETKPRESADIDIYYQMSDIIPLTLQGDFAYDLIPVGSTFTSQGNTYRVKEWDKQSFSIDTSFGSNPTTLSNAISGDIRITTPSGRVSTINLTGTSGATELKVTNPGDIHKVLHEVNWSNCWAFGNGVESDRIRDDYNARQMDNGVKASSVLAGPVKQERREHGVIWSGVYNSNSGVNNTNQFIMAEAITKDINPTHGSVQRLLNRETRLLAFCENKVLRADTNKDALYNADGSSNVVASNTVVGSFVPYVGKYGISRNPESLAVSPTTAYFTDAARGQVLALYNNGISNISAGGMETHFKDLTSYNSLLGTFDEDTLEYNLTAKGSNNYTVSYGEGPKSWISFKSFLPECGASLNNKYYTFLDGNVWQHHANDLYSKFYDTLYEASVTTNFGGVDGGVKSFGAINYEGTTAAITSYTGGSFDTLTGDYSINLGLASNTVYDGEYFNLTSKDGWYAGHVSTDMQEGGSVYFKNKEGKYFGTLKGLHTTVVDTSNISVQGLGSAVISHGSSGDSGEVTITVSDSSTSPTGTNWD